MVVVDFVFLTRPKARDIDTPRLILRAESKQGPLTQLVEYLPFKQRVAGSNPARPTRVPVV